MVKTQFQSGSVAFDRRRALAGAARTPFHFMFGEAVRRNGEDESYNFHIFCQRCCMRAIRRGSRPPDSPLDVMWKNPIYFLRRAGDQASLCAADTRQSSRRMWIYITMTRHALYANELHLSNKAYRTRNYASPSPQRHYFPEHDPVHGVMFTQEALPNSMNSHCLDWRTKCAQNILFRQDSANVNHPMVVCIQFGKWCNRQMG